MKLTTVVELLVLDKMEIPYEMEVKDNNGNLTGINKGVSYKICAKSENNLPEIIKLSKDMALSFKDIEVGKKNKFTISFETNPRVYIKDNKAKINFADVPTIESFVPFK